MENQERMMKKTELEVQDAKKTSENEIFTLRKENKLLKDVLVNMLMQRELESIKSIDSSITSLQDMDLSTYFALRNQNIPVNIVLTALNQNKKSQPTTGDITQVANFEKGNKYKEMPRNEFLKEIEKAMRGELM